MKKRIKFGFVRGPYSPYSIKRELDLFSSCENLEVVSITPDKFFDDDLCEHRCVKIKKILPDFLSDLVFRQPYSPVSFIKLENLEEYLKDVDAINCIELYSFISSQCTSIAKDIGKKIVVNVWETIPEMPLHFLPPHSLNVKKVSRQADLFLAYTKRASKYLRELKIPEEKIAIIYPVIDLKKFCPNDNSQYVGRPFRILFNSRFHKEKGFNFLLEAFLQLTREGFNAELWVCGDYRKNEDAYKSYEYVQNNKYPIKFLGYLNYDEMPNIYRQCDVLCLPSIDRKVLGVKVWEEQFGFVLAEAMACGLTIVASDCGAIPEVIGEKNLIVKQGASQDLFKALRSLAEKRDICRYIGKDNRLRAEEMFNVAIQKNNLQEALKKAGVY